MTTTRARTSRIALVSTGMVALAAVLLAGCASSQPSTPGGGATPSYPVSPSIPVGDGAASGSAGSDMTGIGNPASQYCAEQGGTIEVTSDPSGEEGICVLPDGTRIDEWELYRQANPE